MRVFINLDGSTQIVFTKGEVINTAASGLPCHDFAENLQDLVEPKEDYFVHNKTIFIEKAFYDKLQNEPIGILRKVAFNYYNQAFVFICFENDDILWRIGEDDVKPQCRWTNDFGLWLRNNPDAQTRHNLIKLIINVFISRRILQDRKLERTNV